MGIKLTKSAVTVILSEEEALAFKNWRQFEKEFKILYDAGVFGIRNGFAAVHFGPVVGEIAAVEIHLRTFKRGKSTGTPEIPLDIDESAL